MTHTADRELPLVLIAEDDPDILELIVACLHSIDCRIAQASDGRTALELIAKDAPSLAVLDIRMPQVDGLEVTRRLKSDPATRSIAVLVLTASVDGHQPARVAAAGADRYLAKPFTAAQLREAVTELLAGLSRL
jgi:CheY-like chemotaxis protein